MIPGLIKDYGYENLKSFNQNTKKENSNNIFVFKENGTYLRITNGNITLNGEYKIKPSKQIIVFKYKNKLNRTSRQFMKYSVHDNNLHLTLSFENFLRPTHFFLKKSTSEQPLIKN